MRKHHSKRPVVRFAARIAIACAATTMSLSALLLAAGGTPAYAAGASSGDAADHFALDQLGKPYQYGAAGLDAYDCSGLTYRAWRSVGVALPRVAAQQYSAGTHVPLSQVRPGDLVFWASNTSRPSTIYHVAIYAGYGRVVHAPHTGTRVSTMSLSSWGGVMPLATRP